MGFAVCRGSDFEAMMPMTTQSPEMSGGEKSVALVMDLRRSGRRKIVFWESARERVGWGRCRVRRWSWEKESKPAPGGGAPVVVVEAGVAVEWALIPGRDVAVVVGFAFAGVEAVDEAQTDTLGAKYSRELSCAPLPSCSSLAFLNSSSLTPHPFPLLFSIAARWVAFSVSASRASASRWLKVFTGAAVIGLEANGSDELLLVCGRDVDVEMPVIGGYRRFGARLSETSFARRPRSRPRRTREGDGGGCLTGEAATWTRGGVEGRGKRGRARGVGGGAALLL